MDGSSIKELARFICFKIWGYTAHDDLCALYFKEHGWRIIPFGDNGRGDAALELLGLDEFAKGKTSFAFQNATTRIIAVDSKLKPTKRAYYLAHELGHILLEHNLGDLSLNEEREANTFADAFVSCWPKQRIKWMVCGMVALSLLLCFAGCLFSYRAGQASSPTALPAAAPAVSSAPVDKSKIVLYTPSGEKYHNAGCPHIKGSVIITCTLGEAEVQGLGACKSCLPDKE